MNGISPWGAFPGINPSAQWLDFPDSSTAYSSSQIVPVPEPSVYATLFGLAHWAFPRIADDAGKRTEWRVPPLLAEEVPWQRQESHGIRPCLAGVRAAKLPSLQRMIGRLK